MMADSKPIRTEGGSAVYSLTSLYDGSSGARGRAAEWLDINARNLCLSEYTLISEESVPILNRIDEVIHSRLTWEIKCKEETQEPPP
ncbi:hypothetical protein SAMN05216316_1222 [Nitrosovibrio sp. Nv6]|nr:hypothetical protein SAMN05216316_1222 [Nitrosovibrio sp. Nv6]